MLVPMKRQAFDSLDPVALVWACIGPAIKQVRGQDFTVKSEVYAQLSTGQRALFMFQVLYGHALGGVAQFFSHYDRLLARPGVWSEFRGAMRYFGDAAMPPLLEEMEGVYRKFRAREQQGSADLSGVCAPGPDGDPELISSMGRLDAMIHEIVSETLQRIDAYIRKNPDEFVQLEG